MASIVVKCPECDKTIKGPADLAGKKIRCKDCGHTFLVPRPEVEKAKPAARSSPPAKKGQSGPKPAPPSPKPGSGSNLLDEEAKPYSVSDMEFLPRCPYCAQELESDDAIVCLHCGYNTRTRERHESRKILETSGLDVFLWLLPGILCAIGVLLCIGILVTFWLVFPRLETDLGEQWYSIFFGLWARIWGSVIVLFVGFFLTKFALRRLIFNNKPPEVIKKK